LLLCHSDDNIDMYALLSFTLNFKLFSKNNSSLFFSNWFQINLLTQIAKNLKNPYCKKKTSWNKPQTHNSSNRTNYL
jgi:hypothetical protein